MQRMYDKYHQNLDEIIKSASPEQRILWENILLKFGDNIGVTQVMYPGGHMPLTDMQTYKATNIYLYYYIEVGFYGAPVGANFFFYHTDELNAINFAATNVNAFWDATAAAFKATGNLLTLRNSYFGRVVFGSYTQFKMLGFRISI